MGSLLAVKLKYHGLKRGGVMFGSINLNLDCLLTRLVISRTRRGSSLINSTNKTSVQ